MIAAGVLRLSYDDLAIAHDSVHLRNSNSSENGETCLWASSQIFIAAAAEMQRSQQGQDARREQKQIESCRPAYGQGNFGVAA